MLGARPISHLFAAFRLETLVMKGNSLVIQPAVAYEDTPIPVPIGTVGAAHCMVIMANLFMCLHDAINSSICKRQPPSGTV